METSETLFMGKPFNYWVELERKVTGGEVEKQELLLEIAKIRGKLDFYESRIKQLAAMMSPQAIKQLAAIMSPQEGE